eukprot:COSAG01_NODE_9358_length_2470_cov_47.076761_3_plen_189_part_00
MSTAVHSGTGTTALHTTDILYRYRYYTVAIRRIYSTGTGTTAVHTTDACIYQPVLVQLYGSSWTGSTSAGVVDSVRECGCIQVDSVSLSNRRTERRRSDYSFVDCPRTARAHAVVDTRHLRCTRRLVRYCLLWYCEIDTSIGARLSPCWTTTSVCTLVLPAYYPRTARVQPAYVVATASTTHVRSSYY